MIKLLLTSSILLILLSGLVANADELPERGMGKDGGVGGASVSDEKSEPSVKLDERVFDFGSVREGVVVEHDFVLENTGEAPLRIEKIHPACGCTAAVSDRNVVPGGERTRLNVRFDTQGFGNYKEKTVRVYTNDPKASSFLLTLKGNVERNILVDPPRAYFGKLYRGNQKELTVKVSAHEDSKIELGDVFSRSEHIAVSDEGTSAAKSISIKLENDLPLGVFRSAVIVKTSSKEVPIITIPVFARVVGKVELVPSSLSFGLLRGPLAADESKSTELRNLSSDPISVESVEVSNPSLKAGFEVITEGKLYRIFCVIKRGFVGTLRDELVVEIRSSRGREKLRLPVYAIVAKKGA